MTLLSCQNCQLENLANDDVQGLFNSCEFANFGFFMRYELIFQSCEHSYRHYICIIAHTHGVESSGEQTDESDVDNNLEPWTFVRPFALAPI